MDYEKKYKEALERAKQLSKELTVDDIVEQIFPELKESEDERIRTKLLNLLKELLELGGVAQDTWSMNDCEQFIAWLEKRGGEQNLTLPKWKYKKDNTPLLRDSLILNKYGCVAKSPSGALVSDVWVIDYDELAKLPKEEFEFLKDRYTWKPSESDIRILKQVIDGIVNPINYHATLHAILEHLKKLREE